MASTDATPLLRCDSEAAAPSSLEAGRRTPSLPTLWLWSHVSDPQDETPGTQRLRRRWRSAAALIALGVSLLAVAAAGSAKPLRPARITRARHNDNREGEHAAAAAGRGDIREEVAETNSTPPSRRRDR